jgi:DNA-binding GntR family transcriptional regulator
MNHELLQLQSVTISSLRAQILDQMRDAILNGMFRPGQKLVETVISDRLGVSRAPVREALSALESEGLVISIPRRGSFVIDLGDKDIEEIYSLRLLLERGALQRAMNRFTEADFAEMQGLVDEIGRILQTQATRVRVTRLDLMFHETICRVADHSRLYSMWNSMRWQTQLLIGLTSETHVGHPQEPKEYHQIILNAIESKDVHSAEAAIIEHLQDAQQRALSAMRAMRQQES